MNDARDALIVVDMQHDFLPGGALAVLGGHEIMAGVVRLMPEFSTVVCTQDWHPAGHASFASSHLMPVFSTRMLHGHEQTMWPDHCVQGTPGAAIHPVILDKAVSLVLRKGADPLVDSYSAFNENWGPDGKRKQTGLMGFLLSRGITRVHVCGLARDYCVKWTAIDASGVFDVRFLWDLTRPVDAASDESTRAELVAAGVAFETSGSA